MERLKLTIAGEETLVYVTIESMDAPRARQVGRWLMGLIAGGAVPAAPVGGVCSDEQAGKGLVMAAKKRRGAAIAANLAAAKRAGATSVRVGGRPKRISEA